MTLDEFHAIDPLAMWAGLSSEAQASIIRPLLTSVFAEVCQDCDGTDCSPGDQSTAAGIVQDCHQQAYDAIEAAFYDVLGPDDTALHDGPTADMIDGFGKVAVKGLRGRRVLRKINYSNGVRIGGRMVEVAGFKNVGTLDAPVWEAWTVAQVGAERVRRHPEQFIGPRCEARPAHLVAGPPGDLVPTICDIMSASIGSSSGTKRSGIVRLRPVETG